MQRVLRAGELDLAPVEPCLAHVDADRPPVAAAPTSRPAPVSMATRSPRSRPITRAATQRVFAAGVDLAAIGVVDAQKMSAPCCCGASMTMSWSSSDPGLAVGDGMGARSSSGKRRAARR